VNRSVLDLRGIGKSTLHYLRKKSREERPFTVHRCVKQEIG
jgi:hypothetical protein